MPRPSPAAICCLLTPWLLLGCAADRFDWRAAPMDLGDYRARFMAAAGTRFVRQVTRASFLMELRAQRVLWLGDHHRSKGLHRLQRDLLAELVASGRRPVLALEAIGEQDEADVREFLAGGCELAALQARMRSRWPDSWLDDGQVDGSHYRDLLLLARQHRLTVVGLEPTPRLDLPERDRRIAANVLEAAAAAGTDIVAVVVGQTHLLGGGDLYARVALPAVAVGGEPPPALRGAAAAPQPRGDLLQSDGGLWWFAELLVAD